MPDDPLAAVHFCACCASSLFPETCRRQTPLAGQGITAAPIKPSDQPGAPVRFRDDTIRTGLRPVQ